MSKAPVSPPPVKGPDKGHMQKERTIFVLYIPGGAMLGIMPALMLNHLEKLTECSTPELFQVFDGVSTGSILVAGLNMRSTRHPDHPMLTGYNGFEMFCKHGPRYFPHIPNRLAKMWTANALNMFIDYVDPLAADELAIEEMKPLFATLAEETPWEYRDHVKKLQELATGRWLTKHKQREIVQICDELDDISEAIDNITAKISELSFLRTSSSRLGMVFKKCAIGAANFALRNYANDYMFDHKIPLRNYQRIMGDRRLSDTMRSIYVSAYDIKSGKAKTFFSRKQDFFSTAADNPTVTSEHNNKLWDIVMASTANPFAYPPHITEDGTVCSDKAPVHTPLTCIQDVLDHKPADARVKLVVLGTGRYLTRANNMDGESVKERYMKYGVAGNLVKGRELAELEHYVMSSMRDTIMQRIGKENIIEISPRLSPHTKTELMKFPSRDSLNASHENIEKIVQRVQDTIVEEDTAFRQLAQMLVDNLHNLGQIEPDKYKRVCARLGIRTTPDIIAEENDQQQDTIDRNVPQDHGPLKRLFQNVTKIFRAPPPPPPPPTGPAPHI